MVDKKYILMLHIFHRHQHLSLSPVPWFSLFFHFGIFSFLFSSNLDIYSTSLHSSEDEFETWRCLLPTVDCMENQNPFENDKFIFIHFTSDRRLTTTGRTERIRRNEDEREDKSEEQLHSSAVCLYTVFFQFYRNELMAGVPLVSSFFWSARVCVCVLNVFFGLMLLAVFSRIIIIHRQHDPNRCLCKITDNLCRVKRYRCPVHVRTSKVVDRILSRVSNWD